MADCGFARLLVRRNKRRGKSRAVRCREV